MNKQPIKKNSKKSVTAMVIIFAVAAVVSAKLTFEHLRPAEGASSALARTKGNPKAAIRITEFIDFQCPSCARGWLSLEKLSKTYPGKFWIEVKYYPLETAHIHAVRSAIYAECAARQAGFWSFGEILLSRQDQWKGLMNAEGAFVQAAQDAKLDMNALNQCLADPKTRDVIFKEKQEGVSRGVASTPTYFVNGKMLVGPKSLEQELNVYLGGPKN